MEKQVRLPIPVNTGTVHEQITITKPKPSVIADTKKATETGDFFTAMKQFIAGSTSALGDITDKVALKSAVGKMPYKSAEWVAIQILLLNDPDDGVEGIYPCPLCGTKSVAQYVPGSEEGEPELDTRDFISDLTIKYMDEYQADFTVDLSEEVNVINAQTKEVLESVSSVTCSWPTIDNCIQAFMARGAKDTMRLDMGIFVEAMTHINRQPIDNTWKRKYGMFVLENLKDTRADLGQFAKYNRMYGMDPYVHKTCRECGKEWYPEINTSGFFGSALRQ